ncbi:DUF6207 family protein [Streptomyces dubilierae]|uniref:DUF6207 family protein n=1 Tax=Streptomyces dubilierae TaxID=3075533 RepID=A0ABU2PKL6_9ACTN|nr:DUF6207 family protein [Streptomyces sp. DSM 41921]MDT0392356.1 DUF6207 family protein [Streptomyces sp. DSM 41921]
MPVTELSAQPWGRHGQVPAVRHRHERGARRESQWAPGRGRRGNSTDSAPAGRTPRRSQCPCHCTEHLPPQQEELDDDRHAVSLLRNTAADAGVLRLPHQPGRSRPRRSPAEASVLRSRSMPLPRGKVRPGAELATPMMKDPPATAFVIQELLAGRWTTAPADRTTQSPGEPGVRLRCYLDVRQELSSQQ